MWNSANQNGVKKKEHCSAFCDSSVITTNNCLMKIQNHFAGTTRRNVRINGGLTTDPATSEYIYPDEYRLTLT